MKEEILNVEFVQKGLIFNLEEIEEFQNSYVPMNCFEKIVMYTDIIKGTK